MAIEVNQGGWQVHNQGAWQNLSGAELPPVYDYPVNMIKKGLVSGYHCFISAYMHAKVTGHIPLKLPDGTVF